MQTLQFQAMNTSVLLAAEGQGWAQTGLRAVRIYIHLCERRFSRFLPESELSRLNRSNGRWVSVSADMLDLLRHAFAFHEQTDGLFDPSILPDLKRIGYDRSMDDLRGREVASTPASAGTGRPAFSELRLDEAGRRVRLPRGMQLDLGGIAKGWIAEKAAGLLKNYTDAGAVNAGGDMFFFGQRTEEADWLVHLEHPRDPRRMLAALRIGSGGVATSSVVKRAWTQGGEARHHLIDPRTGQSARTPWLSVTVTAPRLLTAEVFAKVLLIAGPSRVGVLLARAPQAAFLAVDENEQLTGSPALLSGISTLWLENVELQEQGLTR